MKRRLTIIGGGAAGFFAAINAAESSSDLEVIILEGSANILSKVKVSGGGRCNLTHHCFDPKELVKYYPRGNRELLGPFCRFGPEQTIQWFHDRGVETKTEPDGRMFPKSNNSQTIIDCLSNSAANAGVEILFKKRVVSLDADENHKWIIGLSSGEELSSDFVITASGSSPEMWKMLNSLGLKMVQPVPSLFTFNIKDKRIEGLSGISIANSVTQIINTKFSAEGPLLITHWGLSGPGILKLSSFAARELHDCKYVFDIKVNWLGQTSQESAEKMLQEFRSVQSKKNVLSSGQMGIPLRLWERFCEEAGITREQKWADLNKKQMKELLEQLTGSVFHTNGKSTFKEEFVTAGGVDLSEIDFRTFECKKFPGLFIVGEALNIDAVTGGFNFQAAWTGGFIAGSAVAKANLHSTEC